MQHETKRHAAQNWLNRAPVVVPVATSDPAIAVSSSRSRCRTPMGGTTRWSEKVAIYFTFAARITCPPRGALRAPTDIMRAVDQGIDNPRAAFNGLSDDDNPGRRRVRRG
jgi:hypothetical protein